MKDVVHGRWIGYVSVANVSQALAAVTGGGGRVLSTARDIANRGTQAIFSDPDGAMLGVMHSSSGDPGEYLPDPGDWTWAELLARDPRAAGTFYHSVFGYDIVPDSRTNRTDSFLLVSGGYSRASVIPVAARPKAHQAWLLFVRVLRVKDTVAQAVRLGGRVVVEPSDTPSNYWRAVIADPTGGHLGVVELDDPPTARATP